MVSSSTISRALRSAMCGFVFVLGLSGGSPELRLVRKVLFSEIRQRIVDQEPAMKTHIGKWPEDTSYGFMRGGKTVHFGIGGWVFDIDTGTWNLDYPSDLTSAVYSPDGQFLLATRVLSRDSTWFFSPDGAKQVENPWVMTDGFNGAAIQPDTRLIAYLSDREPAPPQTPQSISFIDPRVPGKRFRNVHGSFHSIQGFTGNGRYLMVNGVGLVDVSSKKYLPDEIRKDFLGSITYVYSCDAGLVAGQYSEMGNLGSCFLWDRMHKRRLWIEPEEESYGTPAAFSPNDKYLLCEGAIAYTSTGATAFKGLKGIRGKFSPDGRSLVTMDNEAFYIYKLPKESEPIFGVFQKPRP